MKIANILFNFKKSAHDNKVCGVERCFVDYSDYLTRLGNKVISVTQKNIIYTEEIRQKGLQLVEMPAFGQADIFSMFKLSWLFFKFKPNVIICHSGRALFFARIARFFSFCFKTPIVAINHGMNFKKFLKADYVLAVNLFFTKKLIEAGMDPRRAFAIPNMIEVPTDFGATKKSSFRQPIKIGSLGRIYQEKNFDKILQAMAILRDQDIECEYVIGGVGIMEPALKALAKKLNLEKNFRILGWVDDKKNFFESIDIFILPSIAETFGIVLLEAMLYNTPIITSDSWGPDEIIDNEVDGLKVSKDDDKEMPKLLAAAIARLINDQEFAKKLAINAHKKFFENYSAEMVSQRLNDLLHKIAKK